MVNEQFWRNKNVFITGHTGFKGSWLSLWLTKMGAKVTGYALKPPTKPSLFKLSHINEVVESIIADVRDLDSLQKAITKAKPDIVFHMAAQPLVRDSYKMPVATYEINVMGTVNLLEAIRLNGSVRAVVNVTTDKCYENKEWCWGYRENEAMGGYDPYSNSKGCSELVTAAYRNSFFNNTEYDKHKTAIASARAGNVIGGGDWANDRLIPDCMNALITKKNIIIRNPHAIRPWQHVLEPLSGYLILAERLYIEGATFAEGWNFGPDDSDAKEVGWIVKELCSRWDDKAIYEIDKGIHPHEANYLKLDCSKAKARLGWYPKWSLDQAIDKIIEWNKDYLSKKDVRLTSLKQIDEYMNRRETTKL